MDKREKPKSIFQIFTKEEAITMCLDATRKLRELCPVEKNGGELSLKARRIKELCVSQGGATARMWAEISSILLDEKIVITETKKPMPLIMFAGIKITGPGNTASPVMFMFYSISQRDAGESRDSIFYPPTIRCISRDGMSLTSDIIVTEKTAQIASDEEIVATLETIYTIINS